VASERLAFVSASLSEDNLTASFCLTLAVTGARISEVLALTSDRIDIANEAIVFETLKQRESKVFRAVPAPGWLLQSIARLEVAPGARLWPWGRTHGWQVIKDVMSKADIVDHLRKPKALRHALGVEAGQQGVPLNITQRWLGHARIETTSIYCGAIGREERALAQRTWQALETNICRDC
jgi:site-specific recombinase XerD